MSMDNGKRPAGSSNPGNSVYWSSSFPRQPARVLIVEALPPRWSETCPALCDALDNFLSLACSLDGPCRIPLLSLYAISRQQECLLPFAQVRGNLARLRSCVEELRTLPGEGCVRGAARGGELLRQAVLDSLQQFNQFVRHASSGSPAGNNISVEVTVVTSQPGRGVVRRLEAGLKDADLTPLKRLLVVQICSDSADWGRDDQPPEAPPGEAEASGGETSAVAGVGGFGGVNASLVESDKPSDGTASLSPDRLVGECATLRKPNSLLLATEVDLQQVENSVFTMETVLKAWLQEHVGDREHVHLMLPGPQDNPSPVCVKCDMQERLISPALIPLSPNLGVNTESVRDFLPLTKGSANQGQPPRLKAIKTLRADGVCESVLYGLPLVLRPTACWQLDWDEMDANHNLFHALCHTLRSRDLFLLLQVESAQRSAAGGSGVYSHYVLQPSPSLSLLLKPVASRELLLPCSLPVSTQEPAPDALHAIQGCLTQLDEECVLNPLSLSTNLFGYLRGRGLLSLPRYPYRLQTAAARRDQRPPLEGPKATAGRPPRQPQHHGRHLGMSSKARATVAPLPSSSSYSSMGPPPAKTSRPALTLLGSGSRRAPAPSRHEEDNDDDDDSMVIQ